MTPREGQIKSYIWTVKSTISHRASRGNRAAVWHQRRRHGSVTWVNPSVSEEHSVWLASSSSSSELSRALEQALSWLWEKTQTHTQAQTEVTSANFNTFVFSIMGLLCSLLKLWSRLHHLRVMAGSSGCTVSDACSKRPRTFEKYKIYGSFDLGRVVYNCVSEHVKIKLLETLIHNRNIKAIKQIGYN